MSSSSKSAKLQAKTPITPISDDSFKKQIVGAFKILNVYQKGGKTMALVHVVRGIKIREEEDIEMEVGKDIYTIQYGMVKVTVEQQPTKSSY